MAARHSKFHDVSPREHLDRASFLIAFVVGVAGGVILKMIGAHPFITAGFSAIILIAYAMAAWAAGRIRIEPEAIGDNSYYLGFLFTLASLAFTLYQMAGPTSNGGKPIDIPEVISGFGVALSSTIVGVFLRVFMMQMRPDFVAKDRAVRADLNQSYGEFRKNLSGTLSQMKAFSTESIQYAAERDKRLRDATEKYVTDHQEALVQAADALAKNMETSFAEASQKAVNDIAASVKATNKEAQEALQELVSDIQAVKDRLNEQEGQAFEDIQNRRRRLNTELETAEKQMKAHDEAMKEYIKITRRAADAMTKRVVPALDAFRERLEDLPKDAEFEFSEPVTPEDLKAAVDTPFTVTPVKPGPRGAKRSDV
jgi:ElaB/YqjD/DUF883 family membrane-anchored ribosome-binding protein